MFRFLSSLLFLLYFVSSYGFFNDDFEISSNEIKSGKYLTTNQVFNGFGCTGKNISPSVSWDNLPKGTKSIAVSLYDPDAPTGSGWWHWMVVNINPNAKIKKGASGTNKMPNGSLETMTDFGVPVFGGACPPKGDNKHRYILTVYALGVDKLNVNKNTPAAQVGYMINSNLIEKQEIIAYYKR